MIRGIAVLLLFQLLGESLVFLTGLTVPGPAVGLVLLFIVMQATRQLWAAVRALLEGAADGLLANLGLLFVPAYPTSPCIEGPKCGAVTSPRHSVSLARDIWTAASSKLMTVSRQGDALPGVLSQVQIMSTLLTALRRVFSGFQVPGRRDRSLTSLRRLSDHELDDIGLSRGMLAD